MLKSLLKTRQNKYAVNSHEWKMAQKTRTLATTSASVAGHAAHSQRQQLLLQPSVVRTLTHSLYHPPYIIKAG